MVSGPDPEEVSMTIFLAVTFVAYALLCLFVWSLCRISDR